MGGIGFTLSELDLEDTTMALYRIVTRWDYRDRPHSRSIETDKRRADACNLAFRRHCYNALKAQAMLDTREAHRVMEYADNWEEGQALKVGSAAVSWWRVA